MVNPEASQYCLITCAAGSRSEAQRLADLLVERRLAACVQLVDITSAYTWQGKLEHAQECLLLIKTRSALYPRVERLLREHHNYTLPEILQFPVEQGLADYLRWIDQSTTMDDNDEKRLHEDNKN
jgi:periplasmic divalent cation tolerance protein